MGMSFFTEMDGVEIGAGDFLYSFFRRWPVFLRKTIEGAASRKSC
jgi:hypothetical protein